VIAAWHLGVLWFKLMFIATHFINLECAFYQVLGPELYGVCLAMVRTMMLLMMDFKITKIFCVYFRVKRKLKVTYRFLLRMKLALLLYEWWQAGNMIKYKRRTRKEILKPILKGGYYCLRE
jgi:hypothetical protein